MQSLLGGADCSTSSNPLKQVTQREGFDSSLFRDRLAPSARHAGPSDPAAAQSLPSTAHRAQLGSHAPHPFNLSHLSAALAGPSTVTRPDLAAHWDTALARSQRQSPAPSAFITDFQPQSYRPPVQLANANAAWAASFDPNGKGKARALPDVTPQPSAAYRPYTPAFSGMYQGYQPALQPSFALPQGQVQNGHAASQAEMEAAFERALEDARAADAAERAQEQDGVNGPPEEEYREAKGDFEKVWESLRPEAERLNQLAEWERDFSQFTNDEDDLFDVLNESLNRDGLGQASLDEQMTLDGHDMDGRMFDREDGLPGVRAYDFATSNKYADLASNEARSRAETILNQGGSLSEATLLLERALQSSSESEGSTEGDSRVELWAMLGKAHAMDEKEERAMAAFEAGRKELQSTSSASNNGAGELLTNLAISYVNESLDLAALSTLHQYLALQFLQHAGPAPSRRALHDSASPWALHQSLAERYLDLAKEQYDRSGQVEADVQVGLGVLYYMMGEYDDARECWVEALHRRPEDYLMWNRLGATLANSGKPEEAVDAYRRALELRPTFTRAIFNLGVACLNIGVYKQAAEHFLYALSLHPSVPSQAAGLSPVDAKMIGESDDSVGIWATLRRAMIDLGLQDLADQARPGTDLQVFRNAGFEF